MKNATELLLDGIEDTLETLESQPLQQSASMYALNKMAEKKSDVDPMIAKHSQYIRESLLDISNQER